MAESRESRSDDARPSGEEGAERAATSARLCLLEVVRSERGLAPTLAQHLRAEWPGIVFTLREREHLDCVWVCGYEPASARRIRELRARHPEATIVATRRAPREGPNDDWQRDARAAGADHAFGWPLPWERLGSLLFGREPWLESRAG